ncbi:MAG: M48 family metallopeptidase [Acidobacteriota bacterium]
MKPVSKALALWFALAIGALPAMAATAPTAVRPGFNLFSTQQDIELGRQSAAQVEKQIPLIRDPAIDGYVAAIGARLAAVAPGPKFPYQFHVTNLSDVNAFALPGGFMYVNRGLIELVPTEGQLAGVMAHEMAHVALRHQTNQVSKAYLAKAGVGILGGVLTGGAPGPIMSAVGGIGLNALFLKFSRTAESQADIVGAQTMARAGYDANEMASMFELLRKQAGRDPGRLERFLSDHPAPADREARVRQEAARLGRPGPPHSVGDIGVVKSALRAQGSAVSMKQLAQGTSGGTVPGGRGPSRGDIRIEAPSANFRTFKQRTGFFTIDYPQNWQAHEAPNGFGVTIVPAGGVVQTSDGQQSVVYGVVVNHYDPFEGSVNGRTGVRGPFARGTSLDDATNDLVAQLSKSNPYLRPVPNSAHRLAAGGARAISLVLAGTSPVTGMDERVNVLTRELPDGHVLYSLSIAPGRDAGALSPTYERMMGSLRVNDEAAHR